MQRRQFLSGSAVLAGMGLGFAAQACRLFPAGAADRYAAWREGQQVGWQAFSFRREPGQFVVDIEMEIDRVSPQSGRARYRHESREVWKTGWLEAMQSRTRIDARDHVVNAERHDGTLKVDGSDVRPYFLSSYVVPSNLWHRDSRLVRAFLDVENGKLRIVQPRFVGKESLQQDGRAVEANHYTLRGQLNREAWYDGDCALVRWDLPLADGHWVSFRRETV